MLTNTNLNKSNQLDVKHRVKSCLTFVGNGLNALAVFFFSCIVLVISEMYVFVCLTRHCKCFIAAASRTAP